MIGNLQIWRPRWKIHVFLWKRNAQLVIYATDSLVETLPPNCVKDVAVELDNGPWLHPSSCHTSNESAYYVTIHPPCEFVIKDTFSNNFAHRNLGHIIYWFQNSIPPLWLDIPVKCHGVGFPGMKDRNIGIHYREKHNRPQVKKMIM